VAAIEYNAGDDIDAYCKKCKLVLAHVIVALRATKPAKTECKTCGEVHAYRKDAPGTRKRSTKSKENAQKAEYDRLMEGRDISAAEKYKLVGDYAAEQVIDHKTFGIGIVTRQLSDNKLEVFFLESIKVLVHRR